MKIKPFYTYYVAHVIRQYFADVQPTTPTKAYVLNYNAAKNVLSARPKQEQDMFRELYAGYGPIAVKVDLVAEKYGLTRDEVWNRITELERRVAQERVLI